MHFNKRWVLLSLIFVYYLQQAQVMNIRNWRKSEKDSLELSLLFVEEKNFSQAYPILESIFYNHPNEDYLKYTIAKCIVKQPGKQELAYKHLSDVHQNNKKIPEITYYLAQAAYYNYNFDEALGYLSNFLSGKSIRPEMKKNAEILKENINYAKYYSTHPNGTRAFNPGNILNTPDDEFSPNIAANDSFLIFNYCGVKSNGGKQNSNYQTDERGNYQSDIFITRKSGDELTVPQEMKTLNGRGMDMVLGQSHDGRILFVYHYTDEGKGDIYQSDLIGNYYSKPYKLKGPVNSSAYEGACSLSSDGKTLYFVSERAGGKGGKDIYKASLSADSNWVNIINLGDSVNTAFDEESPFIQADGKTLYFSSKGRTNSGGYDVFKTTLRLNDSVFKKAENMGYPINSPNDDAFFVINASGETAYLSSDRKDSKGQRDIFHIEINSKATRPSLCLLKGRVTKNEIPIATEIKVMIASRKNTELTKLYSNSSTGNYLLSLPSGENYELVFTLKNYTVKKLTIDLTDMSGYIEKTKHINFDSKTDSVLSQKTPTVVIVKNDPSSPATLSVPVNTLSGAERFTTQKKVVIQNTIAVNTPTANKENEVVTVSNRVKESTSGFVKKDSVNGILVKQKNDPVIVKKQEVDSTKWLPKTNSLHPIKTSTIALKIQSQKPDTIKATAITASANPKEKTILVTTKPDESTVKKDSLRLLKKSDLSPKPTATITKEDSIKTSVRSELPSKPVKKDSTGIELKPALKTNAQSLSKKAVVGFVARNAIHEKMKLYCEKYGEIEVTDLSFRAQISAFKGNSPYELPNLSKLGKIEELKLGDGYTRLMLGGSFKSYLTAFDLVKKIIAAGHDNVYIVAIYKGERYSIEDLEAVGIFR